MTRILKSFLLWFDTETNFSIDKSSKHINWLRCSPFIAIHLACLAVFYYGVSAKALYCCLITYSLRVFSLTAFYHRYFSHRSFKTSRVVQFIFAFIGATSAQRGPLWWAAHHRDHHKYSDTENDKHSPIYQGFLRSHIGWFLEDRNFNLKKENVKDLLKYPELVFLNRYDFMPPLIMASLLYWMFGMQVMLWGYFVSTVLVYQVTFSVNSIAHLFGKRPYPTNDKSRNNWWLAILTFGEGWHNNHHFYPASTRQGFKWYQIDISYIILRTMSLFGLVWDIREPRISSIETAK